MKKSEMQEILANRALKVLRAYISEDATDDELLVLAKHMSHALLNKAEELGMQPPGYQNNPHIAYKREWESENSVTETEPDVTETEGN